MYVCTNVSAFSSTSYGIAYAGADGSIQSVNPAFATMLGYQADQVFFFVLFFLLFFLEPGLRTYVGLPS